MKFLVGAYLIKAPASKRLIDHYLVALVLTNGVRRWYRVVEKTTDGLRWHETDGWDQSWEVEKAVTYQNLPFVLARLQSARAWTGYDPLVDNCEQFGRFVVEGKHYSSQVRTAAVGIACFTALALVKPDRRVVG